MTPIRSSVFVVLFAQLCSLSPLAAAQQQGNVTFSQSVTVDESTVPADILKQSDNYADGVFTLDGRQFVFDEYNHLVLQQPERGWLCRWFGVWCPTSEAGPMTVTLDDAKDIVRAHVIPAIQAEMQKETGRVLPLLAFSWPAPMPSGAVISRFFKQNAPMNVLDDSWFFFIDLDPFADFGHRTAFVLVDGNTGAVRMKRAFSPPVIDGNVWLLDPEERLGSKDRFYPESLEDLPEAGSWPLPVESAGVPLAPQPDTVSYQPSRIEYSPSLYSWKDLLLPSAYAQAAVADPCAGKPPKKVAIVINGEPRERDKHFEQSAGMAMTMLRRLGVQSGDLHYYSPDKTPKPEDVIAAIERIGSTLGPCDKLFFYITGHGTLTDKNNDDIPDTPSMDIVYGKGTLSKTRYGNSITEALEQAKAGNVNIIVQSCFAGSLQDWIRDQYSSPPEGSQWHLFLSSPATKSSYGNRDPFRSSLYTEGLAYCVNLKLAQRGITNPTIAQIEEIMRECQNSMAEHPEETLEPLQTADVQSMVVSVLPNLPNVKEGDDGRTNIPLTITRSNTNRDVEVHYSTMKDSGSATPGQDYERIREESKLTVLLRGNTLSVPVDIGVFGDTDIEPDEEFFVWFPELATSRLVTIVNDDFAQSSAASSRPSTAWSSSSTTTVYMEPITIDPKKAEDIPVTVVFDGGLYVGAGDTVTVTLKTDLTYLDDSTKGAYGTDIQIVMCDPCEELQKQVNAKKQECAKLQGQLSAADADVKDFERQLSATRKSLDSAKKALDAFDNPTSYASADGRYTDSTDLQITDAYNRMLWGEYQAGTLTAAQLEEKWQAGLSDADRAALRKQKHDELQKAIDTLTQKMKDVQAKSDAAKKHHEQLQGDVKVCAAALADLEKQLADCVQQCTPVDDGQSSFSSSFSSVSSLPSIAPLSSISSIADVVQSLSSESSVSSSSSSLSSLVRSRTSSRPVTGVDSSIASSAAITAGEQVSTVSCPSGTTASVNACEATCSAEGGTCSADKNGCYSCVVLQCPSGTTKNICPSECSNGCDIAAQQGSTTCYKCTQSCEEVCASKGYAQVGTNWNAYLQEQLNQYSCVSSAQIRLETATVGDCTCSNSPSIQVNQTPPVCAGSPCGDVSCGQSATCQQGDTTVTVHCNWGGWKNIGENQFQPIVGQ